MSNKTVHNLRIALISSFPANVSVGSGVVRIVQGYGQILKEQGFHVDLIQPEFQPTSYLNLAVQRLRFNKILQPENYDLMIGSDFDGFTITDRGLPKIVLNAGILADIVRFESGKTQRVLKHLSLRECQNVLSAQAVIVPSKYTAQKVQELYGVSSRRLHIIPLGIDWERWQTHLSKASQSRKRPPTILCVAKQYPRKGIADLIRAFAKILTELSQTHLCLVGGGPEFEANRTLAQNLGIAAKIDFIGDVNDDAVLAGYYRNADVFCLPSYHETFGIAFVEAMAAGLPVVAYRTTAVPEVVDESAGILVEPENIDRLAQNLVTLFFDAKLRRKMGRAGQTHARKFTWKKSAAQLIPLLKS